MISPCISDLILTTALGTLLWRTIYSSQTAVFLFLLLDFACVLPLICILFIHPTHLPTTHDLIQVFIMHHL